MTNNLPEKMVPQSLVDDAISIVQGANRAVLSSITTEMVKRNWFLGKIIAQEEINGGNRDNHGKEIPKTQ